MGFVKARYMHAVTRSLAQAIPTSSVREIGGTAHLGKMRRKSWTIWKSSLA